MNDWLHAVQHRNCPDRREIDLHYSWHHSYHGGDRYRYDELIIAVDSALIVGAASDLKMCIQS